MTISSGADALVVAINPTSGKGKAASLGQEVVLRLRGQGFPVDEVRGSDEADLQQRLAKRLQEPHRALIAVGGDGMVHSAVQALMAFPETPLGIVPAGTGNDVARALGLNENDPLSAVDVIVTALERGPRRVDLGEMVHQGEVSRFAAVYSAGFDALVNERANRLCFPRGTSRYTVAMVLELSTLRPRHYRLVVDGEVVEQEALLVAVANTESFGGGMRVVPNAPIDDGFLEVFTLAPLSRLMFVRLFPRVFSGTHVDHSAVSIRKARSVRIEVDDIVGYADGERGGPLPVDLRILPGALPVLA